MKGLASLALLPVVLSGPVPCYQADSQEKREVAILKSYYDKSENWAMKAIVMIALSEVRHPSSIPVFFDALDGSDNNLRAYAIECLDNVNAGVLRSGVSAEQMAALIKELRGSNRYYISKVLSVVQKASGQAFDSPSKAKSWWADNSKDYQPAPWTGSGTPVSDNIKPGAGTGTLMEQLLGFIENGLEIAILLDTTGSMQPTIDGARAGIDDLINIVKAIVPKKFRCGLVVYRDFEDWKEGAQLIVPLTNNFNALKQELDKQRAWGGGDFPERVEKAIGIALTPAMGWSAKAGKSIVIVGDAPPHNEDLDATCNVVKEAHENPERLFGKKATSTGSGEKKITPFIVSAIGVGMKGLVNPDTEKAFKAISKAGGGDYSPLLNYSDVVRRILVLSFGQRWEPQIGKFIDWFKVLSQNGLIKTGR